MYDQNGNITQIKDAAGVIQYQYTYDSLGQLIREDNRPMNATYRWSYDDAGNVTYKYVYAFTTGTLGSVLDYTYYSYEFDTGWDDRLISYDGMQISYDEIGNPYHIVTYTYSDGNEIWEEYGYECIWNGRQLMGRRYYNDYCGDVWYEDYYDLSFEYNADGIRTSKTAYGIEYKYLLNGSQIIGETWTEYGTEYLLLYIYDENGSPMGIKYRTEAYAAGVFDYFFFEKNLQGDIVAVYNAEGEKIGSYIYDAWGNFTVSTVSGNTSLENSIVNSYNPFRYRGYYYDRDLGWYYLQTRYYNPQWGRFVNADGYVSTGTGMLGYNMFAYCNNNPVMNVDPTGDFPWLALIAVAALIVTTLSFSSCSAPVENTTKNISVEAEKFDTVEDAVRDFGNNYFYDSIRSDQEYGTIIYEEQEGDQIYYTYSVVSIGDVDGLTHYFPNGKKSVARVHTHGRYTLGSSDMYFSEKDINNVTDSDVVTYLITPAKQIRYYDPTTDKYGFLEWDFQGVP